MAYQPKSYRKFLAGTVSAAVVASAIAPVASASFTDVAGSVHADDIATLVAKGYIKGYADGTFKPNKPLTRGEAAIIFSRILKDAGVKAPEQGAGFPDVPASKAELAEAVAIVKAAGVMGGDEKGNFNPNANITREQMAKVVVEAFKLTKPANHTTKITDLDKAGSWAREYIQTLEANGVTKNTEFAPKQNVTRGQFASFVVRAMNVKKEVSAADITAVKLVDEKTLEVTFNGELKEVKKEDFAIQGVEIDSVSIKAAAAAEAKTTVVVIKTKTALQEGKSYSVSYKGQTTDKAKVDVPVVTPKVESVSAINASQVEVVFNKEVDKETAETAANYSFTGFSGTVTPKLVDGKKVILTLGKNDASEQNLVKALQQETVKVTVKNVKSADKAVTFPVTTTEVKFFDVTIPQVVSAAYVGPGKVEVKFNEPVYATSGFQIDGGKYSASVSSINLVTSTVVLSTGSLADGEHTITVNPAGDSTVVDGSGLKAAKTDVKFTVTKDTTAPTITKVEAKSQKKVVVTFSEPIKGLSADKVFHTAETSNYKASKVTPVADSNGTQYEIEFENNPLPVGNVSIVISKEAVEDNFGNKNSSALTATVSIVADTTKPTVKEVKVVDSKTVTVEFSEDVTGADNRLNYKVKDKDGKEVTNFTATYDASKKKATLSFTSALTAGANYSLEVSAVKDKAVIPNEMDKYSTTFTVADTTAPNVSTTGLYNTTEKKITIFFDEQIDGSTALDKSKYTLVLSDGKQLALPSTATVALSANNTAVVISLPAVVEDSSGNDVSANIKKVIVGQVKDLAGNASSVYTEVTLGGTVAEIAAVTNAKTVDTRTVSFEVATPLKSIAAADFTVNGKNVEFANFENKVLSNGTYGAVVTLKVASADKWATDATPAIATKDRTLASRTLFDGTFKKNTRLASAAEDKVAPAIAYAGDYPEIVVEDNYDDNGNNGHNQKIDTIKVTFTEALTPGTISVDDFSVPGYTVSDVSYSNKVVTIKVKEGSVVDITDKISVKLVGDIADAKGNVLKGDATTSYSPEKTVAELSDASLATEAAKYAKTATIGKGVSANADITNTVVKATNPDTTNYTAKVTSVTKTDGTTAEYLAVDADGKVTLAKQNTTAANVVEKAVITITDKATKRTTTVVVDVTIEKQS
ncbi:S-layer homology domain-containing protein [Anoxybacillus flavithermus]|uniref:S-layer homology domain-containing protein n=1 Tax=Anoxybacillus flavithermus TaxID=33934 RepID=UPI0018665852|nr:S-layer homology domain-containing protein [Anoxybacillus flavithermus]MBE2929289.1 hypothetical protein [Anoxybacillus flavithermus]MBE2956209.1 hypothetical protein [Anoxybacillus flavithermus]